MVPIILSGGSGTRLWPYSRSLHPKQFLSLVSNHTMIQETLLRTKGLSFVEEPWIICNKEHRFTVAEQLREIGLGQAGIILEPVGKNTAPAIALAALQLLSVGNDSPMLILPADHVIKDIGAFHKAIEVARECALSGYLVTFGIVPSSPETGYGYIKKGTAAGGFSDSAYKVDRFVEKPSIEIAKDYVSSGSYFWNSGMFLFRPSRYLAELEKHNPEIVLYCRKALELAQADLDFIRVDKGLFEQCPEDSIDYAVMEKTESALMVTLDAGWSDVGSWSALWEVSEKDSSGNTLKGDVVAEDATGCFVQADNKLIAIVGVDDLVIVDTDDSLMVASKNRVQDVKKIVSMLKTQNRPEATVHRKVYRPWGYYDSIDSGDRFQVKRIVVNPGAELSLQMHHHRAEHWIVVSGTALVVNGDTETILTENQSTYIPIGQIHQLKNPGSIPLELIEVQSGSYLGEDDIVRFEDKYGRSSAD
ncbi:mannose-1-phosphate guanylyltransferase/mannose-6-phosphate isomerase [Sessilibacter sp. MAH4]